MKKLDDPNNDISSNEDEIINICPNIMDKELKKEIYEAK